MREPLGINGVGGGGGGTGRAALDLFANDTMVGLDPKPTKSVSFNTNNTNKVSHGGGPNPSILSTSSNPNSNPLNDLPRLSHTPLQIHLAKPSSNSDALSSASPFSNLAGGVAGGGAAADNGAQSVIQQIWGLYGAMTDGQRAQLLKGLLSRSSSKQIEVVVTCLNLKMSESSLVSTNCLVCEAVIIPTRYGDYLESLPSLNLDIIMN
jgi:hypothetical protein